jgi:hypothetical protein
MATATLAFLARPGLAQVVINEIFQDPPGQAQVEYRWEYIELYGRPGTDLSGFAVALLKGGVDVNRDGVPDDGSSARIDEAFSLDGCVLDENGIFALVNTDERGVAGAGDRGLRRNKSYKWTEPDSLANRRWINGLSFQAAHIPSDKPSGRLDNQGSSTYVLVRRRPGHSLGADNMSVYSAEYAWRKGTRHDVDLDGHVDWGIETPDPSVALAPSMLEPYQMVDEIAWSHRHGHKYVRDVEHQISETPGNNPDAISRVAYYLVNPARGFRTRDVRNELGVRTGFEVLPTRIADESFVYGNIEAAKFPKSLLYFDGFDLEGFPQTKAPTDPNGPRYDGSCDPEPDHTGYAPPCPTSPSGKYVFADLPIAGFSLTPGACNDHPTDPRLRQFRFVPGDFNFDGVVDEADQALIEARVGATLDDRVGDPDLRTEQAMANDRRPYRWQGGELEQLLAMMAMDVSDGPDGGNSPSVTERDVAAHRRLLRENAGDRPGAALSSR